MNSEEWYDSIPKDIRPKRNQPFYHLFAENDDGPYIAYVSQQNLLHDENLDPCSHPQINSVFDGLKNGKYVLKESNLDHSSPKEATVIGSRFLLSASKTCTLLSPTGITLEASLL